jgi:dihydrofolate reductase
MGRQDKTAMRRIINSTYITLDGVIQEPQDWPQLGSFNDEGEAIQAALLESCGAVLMGRKTYDVFAASWPSRSGDPFSDRINSMQKYVVSSSLRDPEWANTEVLSGDLVAAIRALKAEDGQDIVQYGFGVVSFLMMENGLLDELRLWVHPYFLGSGAGRSAADTIYRPVPTRMFRLDDVQKLGSGVALMKYSAA